MLHRFWWARAQMGFREDNPMRKRILAAVLGIILTLSPLTASAASVEDFKDVKRDAWYYNAVRGCVNDGVMKGVSSDRFDPEGTVTRGMFVQMLANRTEGFDKLGPADNHFEDVPEGSWYRDAINWGFENNLVFGVFEGVFEPEGFITREQAVTILYNYVQSSGGNTAMEKTTLHSFKDEMNVSIWAIQKMEWAVFHKIIKGVKEDELQPQGNLTRAQAAQIFENSKSFVRSYKPYPINTAADDPSYSGLEAMNTTFAQLSKNTVDPLQTKERQRYGHEFKFVEYPDAEFVFEDMNPSDDAKPRAIKVNIEKIYPQYVGLTHGGAVAATNGALRVRYEYMSGYTFGDYVTKSYKISFLIGTGGYYYETIPDTTSVYIFHKGGLFDAQTT